MTITNVTVMLKEIFRINQNADGSESTELVTEVSRNAKSSDAILGFEWTFDSEMIILTSVALDFYQVHSQSKHKPSSLPF
jgi:hypothetical protein